MTSTTSNKLRVLALFVALMMVLTCLDLFGAAAAADAAVLTLEEIEEIGRLEAPATAAHAAILAEWKNENGEVIYPELFGGFYLNENYKLAVKLVDGDPVLREQIKSIVEDPDILVFEYTDISLNDLYELYDNIDELLYDKEVIRVGISIPDSAINVTVLPETELSAQAFAHQRTIDAHIRIVEGRNSTPLSYLYPGSLLCDADWQKCSLGWYGKATFNGQRKDCVLIAGHCWLQLKEGNSHLYYITKNEDGSESRNFLFSANNLSNTSYYFSEYKESDTTGTEVRISGDYALLATSHTPTNELLQNIYGETQTITSFLEDKQLLTGKVIYKSAGVTGFSAARVLEIESSHTPEESGIRVVDVFSVNPNYVSSPTKLSFCERGDSGTPVYMFGQSSEPVLCGIVSAKDEDTEVAYITPMYEITANESVNFVPYPLSETEDR